MSMNFHEWLLDEITVTDRRLVSLKEYTPEWIALTQRISVLQECYERLKHCQRRKA